MLTITWFPQKTSAQSQITDYAVFGGDGSCPTGSGQTAPPTPGCAVQISSSGNIQGGRTGSYNLVKTTGSATFSGSIHSGRTVVLSNNNSVGGNITAANSASATGTIVSIGTSANISGNIDVNGNSTVGGGTVTGYVKHPAGKTYTGPTPGGGNLTGTPTLPTLPTMPAITTFPAYGTTNITGTTTISPGAYKDMALTGNKTVTFNGPGIYTFKSINNSGGGYNTFKYNFNNSATGNIIIYVHGNVDLDKHKTTFINGGSASRVFMEIHGNGSGCSWGSYAFDMDNGTSNFSGTVWAPYAGIHTGGGSGCVPTVTGALYSGTQVNLGSNTTVVYAPYITCTTPNANAGTDKVITCSATTVQLNGSSTTSGVTYNWVASNGGNISGPSNIANPIATSAGTYTLTVTTATGGCTATDVALVTTNNSVPNANAGADNVISCAFLTRQLNGSSTTPGAIFSWTPSGGGNITSATNIANPTVNAVGVYTLTVTDPANGCTATDAAQIFQGPCIFPYYPPDPSGKVGAVIGSELTSLFYNFNPTISDTLDNIYQIEDDSVYIEVISLAGQYNTLLAMLQSPAYGLTDLIDNGNPTLFISGLYPVSNLKKLDSLPIVQYIDYVRPLFPALSNAGVTTSAGDVSLKSDIARSGFNLNGQGIKVGVLSNSYNTILGNPAATDVANGDLPGANGTNPVQVLKEYPYGVQTDEGRAMCK
ncbi:MAG: hypothetical protein IPJ79_08920 [Bacteroidetes bacterium]|nr:hypothetical protein [Bacteroidota bacterium]